MSEGLVEIKRRKGRIAGFGGPKFPLHTLWCGSNRPRKKFGQRRDGWSFPPAVRELLLQQTVGKTAVHLFGGRADFGIRLDIDPATQPHYIGDAWDPPFPKGSFDVVILDPPYIQLRQEQKSALLRAAAWIAKEHVFWFHTLWANGHRTLPIVEAWLIRVGDQCQIRCLEKFAALEPKQEFVSGSFRGPQQTYGRWRKDLPPARSRLMCSLPHAENHRSRRQAAPEVEAPVRIDAGENSV